MSDRLERVASMLMTAAAVVIAGAIVYRTVVPRRFLRAASGTILALDSVPSWRDALAIGVRQGPASAPLTLVEMGDLECPACRAFQTSVDEMVAKYPRELAVVFVNFPLSQHRFAMGAARAGICAARMGRFAEWRNAVFTSQDSLGLKSWGAFAVQAGIRDTSVIAACARDPAPVPLITAGLEFGSRIGLTGTPTVILNGWRFSNTPTSEELEAAIKAELAGQRPPHALVADAQN